MPKISIIIPVYNVENFLEKSLDSVLNQTMKDIEIICIDDCSTDNSPKILEEYSNKDSRIVVLTQKINQGPGAARNRGIKAANGEYIMFLDPDDWFEQDALESAYNQVTKNHNDFAYFNINFYYETTSLIQADQTRLKKLEPDWNNPNIKFSELKYPFFGYGECFYKIYNREFLQKNDIKFLCQRFAEDIPFYVKAVTCSKSVSVLNKPLYNYRIHSNNTIKKTAYLDLLYSHEQCFEICKKSQFPEDFTKKYSAACINSLIYWLNLWKYENYSQEKDFYNRIKNVFINLTNQKLICFDYLDKKYYTRYKRILKYNFFIYKLLGSFRKLSRKIISLKNVRDEKGKRKLLTIFGFNFQLKTYSSY